MASPEVRPEPPLIVIVGPTASGKTALAVELAEKYGGEIICADSRTVYRYMDIGTAKPSATERMRVPHWGIDLVDPDENFTASDFKEYALNKIADIRRRNRVPFMVGGTGLYIDAVLFDYQFGAKSDPAQRAELQKLSIDQLQQYCIKNNIDLPENDLNKRYLIRAIERKDGRHKRNYEILGNTTIVGIATDKGNLHERITSRVEQLFTSNVAEEARSLGEKYGWDSESMTGNIYPILHRYIMQEINIEEAKSLSVASDRHLAKRQMTWFRRNPYILWGTHQDVSTLLSKVITRH